MEALMKAILFGAAIASLMGLVPLLAHHSVAAEFDMEKPVTVSGTLTAVEWKNPHPWLHVDVKNPDGSTVSWQWELGSPNSLLRRGWRRTDLPIGAVVTIQGFGAREGVFNKPTGSTRLVKLPDGRELFDGPPDSK
jgi:uncharacterized protein DUF6152